MLRALVLDDEWPARSFLVELLQGTGKVEVVAAVATLTEAQQALAPDAGMAIDVVFVDVQLRVRRGDDSGLAWVREAARLLGAPQFVLATGYERHALEAFELGLADYLVKPFTEPRVKECVRRLCERRAPPPRTEDAPPRRIAARRRRGVVFLELPEVWGCEASDRLTYVHSARGRFDLDITLSAIGASFGRTLTRVHRSWLVNVDRVIELGRENGEMTLLVGATDQNAVRVPVAKERTLAVRDLLMHGTLGLRRL
jgi:two-component system, LytTR family, response regulator LytT